MLKRKKVHSETLHVLLVLLGFGFFFSPLFVGLIIIIIINLIYIAQFDTNSILTPLYIVIAYIQMQYVHV